MKVGLWGFCTDRRYLQRWVRFHSNASWGVTYASHHISTACIPSLHLCILQLSGELVLHLSAILPQLSHLHPAVLVNSENCCMLVFFFFYRTFFFFFFTVSIWQPNFTKSASGLRSCWLDHPNWSVFRAPRQGAWLWPNIPRGLDVGGVISSLCWQEALIYGTQERFFKLHIWSFPDARTDERAPPSPRLSREQIGSLLCTSVCQIQISSWWQMSPCVPLANKLEILLLFLMSDACFQPTSLELIIYIRPVILAKHLAWATNYRL